MKKTLSRPAKSDQGVNQKQSTTNKKLKKVELHYTKDKSLLNEYEIALANIVDYVYTFDLNGRFTFVNKPLLDLWGLTLEEAVGKNFKDLGYPPHLVKLHASQIKQVIKTKKPVRGENSYTNFEGKTGYYEYTFVPVFDAKGNVKTIAGTTHDITDHKNLLELKLKASEEEQKRLAAIVESSDDAIISKNMDGIITTWNKGAEQLYGYKAEEVIGKPISILMPPEKKDDFPMIMRKLKQGKKIDHYETKRQAKDGRVLDVSITISPVRNSEGKIIGASKIARDITERRTAEEAQERLAAIVESSDDAIVSKNLASIVITWNKGAEKIFGYKSHEIIGKSIRTIIPPELEYEEDKILATLKKGKRIDHFQTVRMAKDGRRLDISLTVYPIKDKKGHVIGASKIARDITQEKYLQRQKDEFLGIASHELKTPVTSIKSFAQLLKLRFTKEGNKNAVELLGKLDAQVDKLTNLIGDLLDITKIEAGRMQFNYGYFSFDDLVDEIVEELQRTTDKHSLIKKGRTGKTIYADREHIGQVLNNLIANAIKYSPYAKEIYIYSLQ